MAWLCREPRGRAWQLHDHSRGAFVFCAEAGARADHSRASHGCGLDGRAALHERHQRDHATVGIRWRAERLKKKKPRLRSEVVRRRALRSRRGERTQKISLAGRRQKKPSAEGEAAKGFKALNVRSLAKSSDRRQSANFGQKSPRWRTEGLRPPSYRARFGKSVLPQTMCADCAESSGDLLPSSPPAEKATARQD
jgi:hypothetical protein